MSFRAVSVAIVLCLTTVFAAHAQTLRVTAERTNLRDKPAANGAIVGSVVKGDELSVVDRSGTWYRVRTASGQEGYVSSLLVEVVAASAAPTAPAAAAAAPSAVPPRAAPPVPAATPAAAPVTPAEDPVDQGGGATTSTGTELHRYWLDLNVGVAMAAEDSYIAAIEPPLFDERARFESSYTFPRGASLDVGAGFLLTDSFGVGITIAGTAHAAPATMSATVPHPRFFNAAATGIADTGVDIERRESAVHIKGVLALPTSERLRFRVFGGPSYFKVKQDTVDDILYDQTAGFFTTANTVTVTGARVVESEASAWGFHVGGDASYFFSRNFGLGAFARFSRATVELEDLVDLVIETKAGGFQAGGGLRIRF
jgi:hypothetical protein